MNLSTVSLALLLTGALAVASPPEETSHARIAHSIAQKENWDGHSIGAADERGRYQFKPSTWFQHSRHPLWWASSSLQKCIAEQDRVARCIIAEAEARLPEIGMTVSVYTIALAWNCGLGALGETPRRIPDRAAQFARDVETIYDQGDFSRYNQGK
jgi:hypothetical protein